MNIGHFLGGGGGVLLCLTKFERTHKIGEEQRTFLNKTGTMLAKIPCFYPFSMIFLGGGV